MTATSDELAVVPAPGQRLDAEPDAIVLEFSERVDPSTITVEPLTGEGARVDATPPAISNDGLGRLRHSSR